MLKVRIMIRWRVMLLVLISFATQESDASFVEFFRKLGQADQSFINPIQMSPSPSPFPGPADPPKMAKLAEETCDKYWFKCHDYINKMTACIPSVKKGSLGSSLLVMNEGESDLNLKVTILPMNYTDDNVSIPRHQVKKINVSSNIGGSSSIILKAGNGNCVIYLGALTPLEKFYQGYVTPINAAYLLFGTTVLVGGTWACCRMRKKERHLDGVPYQELEMEQQQQQQQSLPYVDIEAADNWDQSWDDDWDEEKAVRSPGGSQLRSRQANGFSSRSVDTDEWESD